MQLIKLNAFRHHGVTGEALNWDECSKEEIDHFHNELAQRVVAKCRATCDVLITV